MARDAVQGGGASPRPQLTQAMASSQVSMHSNTPPHKLGVERGDLRMDSVSPLEGPALVMMPPKGVF